MARSTQEVIVGASPLQANKPDWERGWRYERMQMADGKEELVRIPLTDEEILHPEEGYIMPERTYHELICDDLGDMLKVRYEEQTDMAIFHDLIFEWDQSGIGPYAPDIAIVPNVRNRDADRGRFLVTEEGTRPLLIIEVVSPSTRENDRVKKVKHYARVGVQEYIYIDHWTRKGQEIWEIVGYRLDEGQYVPMLPDEDGALYCRAVGLRIGVENGKVWVEDAETGEDLLTNLAAQRALRAAEVARRDAETKAVAEAEARQAAEVRADAEAKARRSAEARIAELEAQVRALHGE